MSSNFWDDDAVPVVASAAPQTANEGDFWEDDAKPIAAAPPAEDKHDLIPFLKEAGSGLLDQAKQGAVGVGNAIMHPIDTMNSFSNTVENVRDHPIDALEGVGRAVRSLPGARDMLTDAQADYGVLKGLVTGKPALHSDLKRKAQEEQDASDEQHAKEHPLTDFIQRSTGLAGTGGGGVIAQAGGYAADAFKNSLADGNDAYTAMKDARNVAALFGTMHAAGAGIGKAADAAKDVGGFVGKKIGNAGFGVPEASTERFLQNPEKMSAIIAEGPGGLARLKDNIDNVYNEKVTKIQDQAEAGQISAKQADEQAALAQKHAREDYQTALSAYNDSIASLKNVKPEDALTQDVISGVKKENSKLTELSSNAYSKLEGKEFPRQILLDEVNSIQQSMLVDGKAPTFGDSAPAWGMLEKVKKAIASNDQPEIDSLMNQVETTPGLAGQDLKRIIQQLDQESSAAYATYGTRGAAKQIKAVRDRFDPFLKKDDDYKAAMIPTAAQSKLVNGLTRVFGSPEKARLALLKVADPEKGPTILNFVQELDKNNGTNISAGLKEYMDAQNVLKDPEARIAHKNAALDPYDQNIENANAARDVTQIGVKDARQAVIDARDNASQYNRLGPGSTENTIKSVARDKNIEAQKQVTGLIGEDALHNIKDWQSAQGFIRDTTAGSRKTQLMSHVGKAVGAGAGWLVGGVPGTIIGGFIGDSAGAMLGAGMDKYGGKIWRHVLNGSLNATPYAKTLVNAAKRGPQALAVAHYTLSQRDPDYRETIRRLDEGDQ